MFPQPWKEFLPHGTAHLSEGEQYATPRSVHLFEGPWLPTEHVVRVNSVVDIFRSARREIGEDVGEYLVRNLEYYEAVVGSEVRRPRVSARCITWARLVHRLVPDFLANKKTP